MNEYGYRDIKANPLPGNMLQSPTGRQLSIDGSLVFTYTTVDPEDAYLTAPDGSTWQYFDGTHKYIVTFDRTNGFQRVQVS